MTEAWVSYCEVMKYHGYSAAEDCISISSLEILTCTSIFDSGYSNLTACSYV